MSSITSQRSSKFYLSIALYVLFFLVMALIVGGLHGQAKSKAGEVMMILMSAGLVFGAFYTVIRFFKNAPKIAVDDKSISFNDSTYYWKDLKNIEMTGKRPFKFIGEQREGVLLKFNGQDERYIFDDMYGNAAEIKRFIQQTVVVESPSEFTKTDHNVPVGAMPKSFKYYKGVQFFCFEGIALWGLTLFLIYIGILDYLRHNHRASLIMPVIFGFFMFILFSQRMYYFGLSENLLAIRNQNFPWVRKVIPLFDIREIVFEQKHKMPVTLRIIKKDFTSQTYPAATIWSKKWMMLKNDLEKKGIKVRNECVYYEPFEFKFFND